MRSALFKKIIQISDRNLVSLRRGNELRGSTSQTIEHAT